jgi:hypothetical protein
VTEGDTRRHFQHACESVAVSPQGKHDAPVTLKIPMENFHINMEEFKVLGKELVDKVQELLHEGNIRRIIIRDDHGHTFVEIPLTVAAVGAVIAPVLAAVGAIAAYVANFTIVVERVQPHPADPPAPPPTETKV